MGYPKRSSGIKAKILRVSWCRLAHTICRPMVSAKDLLHSDQHAWDITQGKEVRVEKSQWNAGPCI